MSSCEPGLAPRANWQNGSIYGPALDPRRSEYHLNTHPEAMNTKHDFNDSNRALQIHAVEA